MALMPDEKASGLYIMVELPLIIEINNQINSQRDSESSVE